MKRKCISIAALLLAGFLAAGFARAESGYRMQYDFPDQGDDWYGSVTAPDPRHDFPRHSIETYSDGEEFGLGYERLVDLFGFGPPTDLTRSSLSEYVFRFGDFPVEPYTGGGGGCTWNSECLDGTYCNGVEVCFRGHCLGGSPPVCGDADPCTFDYCDVDTDACAHAPITDPGEVHGLMLGRSETVPSVAVLTWFIQPPSIEYNVYRGQDADLFDLACHQSGVSGTTLSDDGTIAAGDLYVFLVTGFGCGGESTLGPGLGNQERPNPTPCP